MFRVWLTISAVFACGSVFAVDFYKWVDADGVTHYSAQPPLKEKANTVDVRLRPLESADDGTVPGNSGNSVVIYTAEWCGICKSAKRYFASHNVPFTEYDVEKTIKGAADYRKMNGRGVPIILVGDRRMDGFNTGRFERMMQGE